MRTLGPSRVCECLGPGKAPLRDPPMKAPCRRSGVDSGDQSCTEQRGPTTHQPSSRPQHTNGSGDRFTSRTRRAAVVHKLAGNTDGGAELEPNGYGTTVACNRSTNTLSLHFVTATTLPVRGTDKDTAAGSNAAVQNPMVLRRLRVRLGSGNEEEDQRQQGGILVRRGGLRPCGDTVANRHVAGKVLETRGWDCDFGKNCGRLRSPPL